MLNNRIFFILIFNMMMFGRNIAQISLYVSPDIHTKMSFNSVDPFEWQTLREVKSDGFSFKGSNYDITRPFNLGISLGCVFSNKNEIQIGIHSDGVTQNNKIFFLQKDTIVGEITPGLVTDKSKSFQTRAYIKYKIYVNSAKRIYISPNFSIVYRGGGKGIGSVGSMGWDNLFDKENYVYSTTFSSFTTYNNQVIAFGLEIGNDFYRRDKYLFTLSLLYSHSKKSLYSTNVTIESKNLDSGIENKYIFNFYSRASGLYLILSKKLFVYPKKNKNIKE